MSWWLVGLAMAGGFTHRTTREPLPARWVERPLVLPAGWKQVDVSWVAGAGVAQGRLSLGPVAELRAAAATDDEHSPTEVGFAFALGRGEAPARSAALELAWQVPQLGPQDPVHRVVLGVPLRRQWGGSRWTVAPRADVATSGFEPRLGLRGEAVLQAGPLGGTAEATTWYTGTSADPTTPTASWFGALGGFVQLNRAIRVHGAARLGDEDGARIGVELSL